MLFVTANIFQPLIDVFESVLKFFHDSVGVSWGFSIVLLTICVRAVLIPLTVKQLKSMARMQQLQPELKAIQAKYKDDKQRQQQEMMKFYKENNVNPLGSCLPMVAQLPVFISLYYMLRQSLRTDICPAIQAAYQHAYQIKHHVSAAVAAGQTTACGPHGGASFLFIPDLTDKATGAVLVVLIVLYVGTQLGSSLMMSSATMDRTQRQIMLFMPLLFVLFVIRFPAGCARVLDHHQPVDDRPAVRDQAPHRPAAPGHGEWAGGDRRRIGVRATTTARGRWRRAAEVRAQRLWRWWRWPGRSDPQAQGEGARAGGHGSARRRAAAAAAKEEEAVRAQAVGGCQSADRIPLSGYAN